ncbi:MAG: cysteine hydrolase family protein [Nitrososphaerales archaeon]
MRLALLVIDMQNGFCSKSGSYDRLGYDIAPYQAIVPNLKKIIQYFADNNLPIFFTKAIREKSGIDSLDRVHRILPRNRSERIKRAPICVRDTWDSEIVEELQYSNEKLHIVEKRRDSAFQDTELELWLRSFRIDTLVFAGVDTYVCVESSVRDGFNKGFDIILLSDCTASRRPDLHNATLEQVKDSYGLVIRHDELISKLSVNNARLRLD